MFILDPDSDYFPIPYPGVKKNRIHDPDSQHCCLQVTTNGHIYEFHMNYRSDSDWRVTACFTGPAWTSTAEDCRAVQRLPATPAHRSPFFIPYQCCGSEFIESGYRSGSRSSPDPGFDDQKLKKKEIQLKNSFFWSKHLFHINRKGII
jgi:hypothetical protein